MDSETVVLNHTDQIAIEQWEAVRHAMRPFLQLLETEGNIYEMRVTNSSDNVYASYINGDKDRVTDLQCTDAWIDVILSCVCYFSKQEPGDFVNASLSPPGAFVNKYPKIPGTTLRISGTFAGRLDARIGASITIRKDLAPDLSLKDYLQKGTITTSQYDVLKEIARLGTLSFLIAGPTGSGKTTLLNAILKEKQATAGEDSGTWAVIEQQAAEISSVPQNTLRFPINTREALLKVPEHLVRSTPSYIIIGEIREEEMAALFLDSTQTGHGGVPATIHATGPISAVMRMHDFCKNKFSLEEISRRIHIVVAIGKMQGAFCLKGIFAVKWDVKNDRIITIELQKVEDLQKIYTLKEES